MRAIAKDEKEIELLKLLDVLAENRALFHSKQGMSIRKRLKVLISEQRNSFVWDAKGRLVFLFRLVLSCPILLSRPPGFEWILEDFIDALHFTLLSTKYGLRSQIYEGKKTWVDINVFREAWSSAWGQLHRGTGKRSVILDYAIARDVEMLMMKEGLAFPDAVEKLAHQQSPRKRRGRGRKDVNVTVEKSTIYAALRRVGERERTRIQTDEVYLPGIGLSKPKRTDLGSDQKKAIREEMLAKRARGYPKPKKKA